MADALGVGLILNDQSKSLAERFRALFTLRGEGGEQAVNEISRCLLKDPSALLKHECAYCLGQMKDPRALPVLQQVLGNTSEDPMVRHEAGEALGAIGDDSVLSFIDKYTDDPSDVVAQTCQLARKLLIWSNDKENHHFIDKNPYLSVDPAPPIDHGTMGDWKDQLIDSNLSLFQRYRAMFALRNTGGSDAVKALTCGFGDDSALFKHEIAYVLGQMKHPAAVEALKERLEDHKESPMVRHECAEALGSIANEKCLDILQHYSQDNERVVRESCLVALDMYQFEHSNDFQYANALT
jgi:deoxyhypusine monooxygenase